jgi:histidine triad (HIT) family protein
MAAPECLFCRIATRSVPADIVGEADGLLAFKDIHPQAPTHLLIIPQEHIASLDEATDAHTTVLGKLTLFATRLARQYQLAKTGYRLVTNCGVAAGQSVWHLHLHLLGGRTLQWPPG